MNQSNNSDIIKVLEEAAEIIGIYSNVADAQMRLREMADEYSFIRAREPREKDTNAS